MHKKLNENYKGNDSNVINRREERLETRESNGPPAD